MHFERDFLETQAFLVEKTDLAYRYGFNGKESDNETSGAGNTYDYGFRMYNPRVGRFLSIDPLTKKYPMLTPYQFASNSPIMSSDLDGLEAKLETVKDNNGKVLAISIEVDVKVIDATQAQNSMIVHVMDLAIQKVEKSYNGNVDINGQPIPVIVQLAGVGDIVKTDINNPTDPLQDPMQLIFTPFSKGELDVLEKGGEIDDIGFFKGNTQAGVIVVKVLPESYKGSLLKNEDYSLEGYAKTVSHELGHLLGLSLNGKKGEDNHSKDINNLMFKDTRAGDEINNEQRAKAVETVSNQQGNRSVKKDVKSIGNEGE
jgi:RHS repeat-associated protein